MEDITNLEQSLTTLDSTDFISTLMFWLIVPSIVIGTIFLIVVIMNSIRRWRMEQAIFEIRDLLRDMKQQQTPTPKQSSPAEPTQVQPLSEDNPPIPIAD